MASVESWLTDFVYVDVVVVAYIADSLVTMNCSFQMRYECVDDISWMSSTQRVRGPGGVGEDDISSTGVLGCESTDELHRGGVGPRGDDISNTGVLGR